MKKMKIYLQYPWKFPDSPYYKYLIDSPPENVEYLNVNKQKGVITSKKLFWVSNFLKSQIRYWFKKLSLNILNAHLSPKGNLDLIHCAHCLSKNKEKPWVADVEMVSSFLVSGKICRKGKSKIRKKLLRKNCKKIFPWTNSVKRDVEKMFPEIKEKLEVVYPAVPMPKIKKKKHEGINLLFVGRYFIGKGGAEVIRCFDYLTKKYSNVEATIVSEVPEEIIKKYSKNKKIKIFGLMPQKKLFDIYSKSDIFVYPGYSDTFGFAILEAMSFGMPVVTLNGNSREELVKNGKTGIVIPIDFTGKARKNLPKKEQDKIVNEMIKSIERLIKDETSLKKMGIESKKEISSGKFSIKERNKRLKKFYEEAIK